MSVITGKDATLMVAGQDNEWHGLTGILDDINHSDLDVHALFDAAKAMADMVQVLVETTVALNGIDWKSLSIPRNDRWLDGHGGKKLRRRKHGGRWSKIDRNRRKPPLWLAERKLRWRVLDGKKNA